jgi:alpha-amylase
VAPRISLALALHNHQPVGTFGWVFGEVFEHAYRPMVEALERHRSVRLALHYTGALLEWLRAEQPAFVERLRVLVERGQVELMGGGLYEPILASLPERDRLAQLRRMADTVEEQFGRRPAGAWLAERVWEPDLPTSLVDAGYAWTILDDAHFRAAAIPEEALWGPYTTDDQGRLLTVFGTEQGLRYRIPFREVDEVIDHLRSHATEAGDRLGTMGDDGEKFGAWPTTYEHCWGRGRWVERFFEALEENAGWLATVTPTEWLASHRPIGRVAVPTGSYAEMGEWALPPDEARGFAAALHAAQDAGRPEARWLRGASWRNFGVRYREVNDLHKQMLHVSAAVDAMPAGRERDLAADHLHRGQSNDCYWHGLFGGLYINHMRLATHEHLVAAEDLADRSSGRLRAAELADLDLDGRDDVRLATDGQVVTIALAEGAGIGAWDIRAARHALGAVLRRRPEAYHETIRARAAAAGAAGTAGAAGAEAEVPVSSIHELARAKEPNLAVRLAYDWHERRAGLVRFLAPGGLRTGGPDPAADRGTERGDFVDGSFEAVALREDAVVVGRDGVVAGAMGAQAVRVEKTVIVGGTRRAPTVEIGIAVVNRSAQALRATVALDWPTNLAGGGGNPAAWWEADGDRTNHDGAGGSAAVTAIGQGNDDLGVAIRTTIEPAAEVRWGPIETVSNSESGFERTYQGSALLVGWPLDLAPGGRWVGRVRHVVDAARDRAEEELAADAPAR